MSDEEGVVLGVDLGTTFSATAIVNRFGKPEIITNAEGHPTTPSVVHFYDSNACVVGDEAVKMVVVDPENVVRFIKRRMGEADFVLDFYERSYTPQEISALILRKLKDDAEERLGHEVRDAVITVPAYFNSAQRGATAEAGAIAGFNVLSIINEPTAAAIAWGISRLGDRKKIMVFDLGGGTFDVTIMVVEGDDLTAIATDGNAELGGKDWDDRLLDFVADQFVATRHAGGDEFRAMIVERGVDQRSCGQFERVKQFEAAPGPHPIAILAPAEVEHIWLGRRRPQPGTQPLAKRKMLDVEAQIDRKPRTARPGVVTAPVDGLVIESVVMTQGRERGVG